MNYVVFICDLYDPNYMLRLSQQTDLKDYKFVFPSSDVEVRDKCFTMLSSGTLHEIKNYEVFIQNRERILDMELDKVRESLDNNTEEMIKNLKIRLEMSKDVMEMAKLALNITLLYLLLGKAADEMNENIDEVIENVSKIDEEMEVTNELEMLSKMLTSQFTKEQINEMKVLKASYNNEEMEANEILSLLSTHVLPQYLTQIDIRDTKDDTYTIETDLCIITREAETFDIKIIKKENDE